MDTHESTTEVSANQMLRDVMNMRKEADESVRHCISRIQHKLNRLDALLFERKIDLSALLQKNRMLEIIGVNYPALNEQLFLSLGLFGRYRVSQVGNSDAASADNKKVIVMLSIQSRDQKTKIILKRILLRVHVIAKG